MGVDQLSDGEKPLDLSEELGVVLGTLQESDLILWNRLTVSCRSVGSGVEMKGVGVMFTVVRDETGLANGL